MKKIIVNENLSMVKSADDLLIGFICKKKIRTLVSLKKRSVKIAIKL